MSFLTNMFLKYLLITSIFFFSCKNNDKNNTVALEKLNKSLERSANTINENNEIIYRSFEDKAKSPGTAEKAAVWQPRAIRVKEETKQFVDFLENFKSGIKSNREANISSAEIIQLAENIETYQNSILTISPEIKKEFDKKIWINNDDPAISEQAFIRTYLINNDKNILISALSNFQNNARVIENLVVTYCHNQTGSTGEGCGYGSGPRFMITQNTLALKRGDILKIKAGIGTFSTPYSPAISINNKTLKGEHDIFSYDLKITTSPGKYKIPVQMSYIREDGLKMLMKNEVEYTVLPE
ncbi:MAG: hypothetical protein QM791_13695 [Ferruginibacter sp.]